MVKPPYSNCKVITANFSGVQMFWICTVFSVSFLIVENIHETAIFFFSLNSLNHQNYAKRRKLKDKKFLMTYVSNLK